LLGEHQALQAPPHAAQLCREIAAAFRDAEQHDHPRLVGDQLAQDAAERLEPARLFAVAQRHREAERVRMELVEIEFLLAEVLRHWNRLGARGHSRQRSTAVQGPGTRITARSSYVVAGSGSLSTNDEQRATGRDVDPPADPG